MLQKQPGASFMAPSAQMVERCYIIYIRSVDIGAMLKKQPGASKCFFRAKPACTVERCCTMLVERINVGAMIQKQHGASLMILAACSVQRC